MVDEPQHWDYKCAKMIIGIFVKPVSGREADVEREIDLALQKFDDRDYDDSLLEDIEGELRTTLNELNRARFIEEDRSLFLTTKEAAEILRRSPNTLRDWAIIGNGPIKPWRTARRAPLLWRVSDINNFINEGDGNTSELKGKK